MKQWGEWRNGGDRAEKYFFQFWSVRGSNNSSDCTGLSRLPLFSLLFECRHAFYRSSVFFHLIRKPNVHVIASATGEKFINLKREKIDIFPNRIRKPRPHTDSNQCSVLNRNSTIERETCPHSSRVSIPSATQWIRLFCVRVILIMRINRRPVSFENRLRSVAASGERSWEINENK